MANLETKISGITFKNPVLPAAGPNVGTVEKMLRAAAGGAGGIVTKTVSVKAASDPRPNIRKTSDGGLLNCETWSEKSAESFLDGYREIKKMGLPLICSIGYSPDDVRALGQLLEREVAPDAFEFSTHYTGKSIEPLLDVARALRESVSAPIWMKISPNTPDLEELVKAAAQFVDGFAAINSVGPSLDFDIENPKKVLGSDWGQGWLSGAPILPVALATVCRIARAQSKPVIGVGGISNGRDAIKHFMAGASAVGVCSAAILQGDDIYGKIAGEISEWLDNHAKNLDDIKGAFIKNV